jgi:HAE1 family hydrophobic/amphiphilic exporter-1
MTLPELAIRRPVTAFMILVSLVVLGSVALFRLPLAFLPEMPQQELYVAVPYPGASPTQIERNVIRPLEEALGTVRGLREMRSHCSRDNGRVNLEFHFWRDIQHARVEVREKIDRVRGELPDDVRDIFISGNWDAQESDSPILEARLSSEIDLSESYDLLDRKIVRPLERIPGVASVRLDGVNPKEVRINLRLSDVEAHRVDLRTVLEALQRNNLDRSLGEVTEPGTVYTLRALGSFDTVEEIRSLPIREDGLRLSDVADVVYQEPPLEYGRHLDGKFAVGITVTKESHANTVTICDEVQRRVAAMNEDPDLQGVSFLIWMNQGGEIRNTLKDLLFTGVFGAILASLVLYVFLRRVSSTVISVVCIPFSLIVACGFIWAQGKSLNTVSLLGLIVGIGMLVDNAVVVMENIFRYQERGFGRMEAARRGASEVSTAVTAATLTSVIVFLPVIFNRPTEMSTILRELGITVCITLLASLFISQTLIPLATSRFIRPKRRRRERWLRWAEGRYVRVMKVFLRRQWLAPVVGIAVTASAVFPFLRVDKNFDTSESELFVQIRYEIAEPLNLDRKQHLVTEVERALAPHKERLSAQSVYSFWTEGWAMTRIYLEEGKANEKEIARVRRELRELLPEIPGVKLEVQDQGPFWRRDRGKRVALQLVGEDSETLGELAEEAKQRVGAIPGLVDPFSGAEGGGEELHVEVDRELASRYGIDFGQPADIVSLSFRGQNLPRFRVPDGEREMRLVLDERETASLSQLENLPLWTDEGEKVPLASVAETRARPGPARIFRENRLTNVWVGARYDEGTREDYIPLVRATMDQMSFPEGYAWTMSNWNERHEEQSREFLINLGLALLLIFAVMASLFESVTQAAVLLVSLLFAVAGAAWTLYATGTDFDQPAAVGLLLLLGIVVNNGIVMLEHVNLYRRRGMSRPRAMLQGGRERLRPILMTALTTLIGLVPIVVQKPALAGVYYYSMALVLMGGLAVSTVLTLVLLPTTVALFEDTLHAIGRGLSGLVQRIRGRRAASSPA